MDTEPTPTAADVAALSAVQVAGPLGATPTLTFDMPFTVSATVARVDVEGTGTVLADGDYLTVSYALFDGDEGTVLGSTWDTDSPERLLLGDPTTVAALNDILRDQRVGVRILAALPGLAATETTAASPATILVLEVDDTRPGRATGETVTPADGLPLVTLADNGQPSIEIPEGTQEPTELVVQPLIKGTGAVVVAGQTLTAHYTGWLWDGTEFDSSWGGAPFTTLVGAEALIAGWDQGLVGLTVGSQVLLVIPPDLAYGAEGLDQIPGDATLVFVIDIIESSDA